MQPESAADVLDQFDGTLGAVAIGAAMELGLFWLLEGAPRDAAAIAETLGIPDVRCGFWLRSLEPSGLIVATADGYALTDRARSTVLATWSQPTWAFLAQEARERVAAFDDLARRLRSNVIAPPGPSYVDLMAADPGRAERFTRMLLEIHGPLAEDVAAAVDTLGVRRALDLGGGSGVVAMALARREPMLDIEVIDIPAVCAVGGRIVGEQGLAGRVRHVALDLMHDPLPTGVDLILECDVGVYEIGLFCRVREALASGGRFVIVGELPSDGEPRLHLVWAMLASLHDPGYTPMTLEAVTNLLESAGFSAVSSRLLPRGAAGLPPDPLPERLTIVEARR